MPARFACRFPAPARLPALLLALCPALAAGAQEAAPAAKKPPNPRLFRSEAPLEATLTLNTRQIRKDRGQDAPWRAATLAWREDGKAVTVPVRVRTRGIWRLRHCDFPPLRLSVRNKDAKGTLLHDLDEPKLVTYCRNSDQYESYVLQEAQLYRIQRVLTEASHKVRLLRLTYADSATGKVEAVRWSFLVEDPAQVAARLGGDIEKRQGAGPGDLDPAAAAMAFTFLYFIANTDISFTALHNGELVRRLDGTYTPIPYDYDFSGVIGAAYATPDPSLKIPSVRVRVFRGFCAHRDAYPAVFERFRGARPAIEALYADSLGALLPKGVAESHLRYYRDFWEDIRTPERARRAILDRCLE